MLFKIAGFHSAPPQSLLIMGTAIQFGKQDIVDIYDHEVSQLLMQHLVSLFNGSFWYLFVINYPDTVQFLFKCVQSEKQKKDCRC